MSERSESRALRKQGKELADALGQEFDVPAELPLEELQAAVDELMVAKAKADAEAEEQRQRDVVRRNENANEYRGHGLKFDYQIAPGKHLQCKIGRLKSGAEVRPGDVGGQKELDKLVESGAVLRRAPNA